MLKTLSIVFGIVFLLVGVLGFVPGVTDGHMLLGIFHVNALHNVVHLLSGAVALVAGLASAAYARLYFRVFGVVYALVAVLGFVVGDGLILGLVSNNMPDTWLHVAIAAVALVLGFGVKQTATEAMA
jgi:hypothetical protein